MLNTLELLGYAAAHTLCWRSRRKKLREFLFQSRQFFKFHVKLIVTDGRFGEDVIIVVVLLQFVTQGSNALSDFFAIHNIM